MPYIHDLLPIRLLIKVRNDGLKINLYDRYDETEKKIWNDAKQNNIYTR